MTTTAPQPVSSPTTEAPSQDSPTQNPGSHPGSSRKTLIGLTATLVLAAGIGGYFAVTSTGTASTTPVTTARPITSGGVDVIERSTATQTTTAGGVDVIERSTVRRSQSTNRPDVTEQAIPTSATVTAESAAAASASHWANITTQTSADTQLAQWTASTRAGLASNDADYGSHWNNDTTGAAAASQPVTSGGVDVIERQGCSVQCLAARARLEARTK